MSSSAEGKLRDVIKYIVDNYPGGTLTRTKLVKLVFLADAIAEEELDNKITDTNYIYYYYGPYSDDIIDTVQEMDGDSIKETRGRASFGKYYSYKSVKSDEELNLSEKEVDIMTRILSDYGSYGTEDLVERVYDEYDITSKEKYSQIL